MDDMDRDRAKVKVKDKDKVRDMVEIVMVDVTITEDGMTDTINRAKVEMDTLKVLRRPQVVRETHRQDLELL